MKRRFNISGFSLFFFLFTILLAAANSYSEINPTVSQDPLDVEIGTEVVFTGSDFSPNGNITITGRHPMTGSVVELDDGTNFVMFDILESVKTIQADGQGNFEVTNILDYESYSIGTHTWSARDDATGKESNEITFTFMPNIDMSPLTGVPGTLFERTGENFIRNGTATLHFYDPDGNQYHTEKVDIDDKGDFIFEADLEKGMQPGEYKWKAVDDYADVSNEMTFSIIPNEPLELEANASNLNLGNISEISDEFQIWLDLSIDGYSTATACEDYTFSFVDGEEKLKVEEIDCKEVSGSEMAGENSSRLRIWFKIDQNTDFDRAAYFENGTLRVCDDSSSKCKDLYDGISVYGTTFDVSKHAWGFWNGEWALPVKKENWSDDIYKAAEVIGSTDYLSLPEIKVFWSSIGRDLPGVEQDLIKPSGVCYGMNNSAIANFTHSSETAWGTGGTEIWKAEVDGNWNDGGALPPFKAVEVEPGEHFKDLEWNFQTAKKILYYHVSQAWYDDDPFNDWTGRDQNTYISDKSKIKTIIDSYLKKGVPLSFGFQFFPEGGHRVSVTQILNWGERYRFMIWDNNFPLRRMKLIYDDFGPYLQWTADPIDSLDFSPGSINFIKKESGITNRENLDYRVLRKVPYYVSYDSQNIYNLNSDTDEFRSFEPHSTKNEDYLRFKSDNLELMLIGGNINSVKDFYTDEEIRLIPFGEIDEETAVIEKTSAGYFNYLYLPKNGKYYISAHKHSYFPGLKLFATIPDGGGNIEMISYNELSTEENDEVEINFSVGENNPDKSVRRKINGVEIDPYMPSREVTFKMPMTPPDNFRGFMDDTDVRLLWKNPENPNVDNIRIIRKTDGYSLNIDDGNIVYEGMDQEYKDDTVIYGTTYYYTAFYIDTDGEISPPSSIVVDTERFNIVGNARASDGEIVENAKIFLTDQSGEVVSATYTGIDGGYILSNLENGIYNLSISHPANDFQSSNRLISIEDQNISLDFVATPVPIIRLNFESMEVERGDVMAIPWSYRNISHDKKVDVEVIDAQSQKLIAQSVDILEGQTEWDVRSIEGNQAFIRISVSDNPLVSDTVTIFVSGEEPPNDPGSPNILCNAGQNQTVIEGATVSLNGSGSITGAGITYQWTQTAGPSVALTDANSIQASFTAPDVTDGSETLTFRLTVSDADGNTATDATTVTVSAQDAGEEPDDDHDGPGDTNNCFINSVFH